MASELVRKLFQRAIFRSIKIEHGSLNRPWLVLLIACTTAVIRICYSKQLEELKSYVNVKFIFYAIHCVFKNLYAWLFEALLETSLNNAYTYM